ncbi:MAG: hypothetical protein JJ992_04785, partial [Planctomycetes bacterium]|nr:hypothetical protein [Planctomycetota bacterium]
MERQDALGAANRIIAKGRGGRAIANVIVGRMETAIKFQPGGSLPGTILPPSGAALNTHTVILDYTAYTANTQVNLGPLVNLAAAPIGSSHLTQTQAGMAPQPATWHISTTDTGGSFTLSFGDRATGQFKTPFVDLSRITAGQEPQIIRGALVNNLTNIGQVAIAALPGTGTLNDPWVFTVTGKDQTVPDLSSDKYAVSKLGSVSRRDTTDGAGNLIRLTNQRFSLFADDGKFLPGKQTYTLTVMIRDTTPIPNTMVNRDVTLGFKATRGDASTIATALAAITELANANVAVSVTGGGTQLDPWNIQFNGPRNLQIEITTVDTSNLKSRGFLQLREATAGAAGIPSEY